MSHSIPETHQRLRAFIRERLPEICAGQTSSEAGYALPTASLGVLRQCVMELGVRRVFEFGTGQSTRVFLEAGCEVVAIEDSADWLADTRRGLEAAFDTRVTFFHLPLCAVWHRSAPILSWTLPQEALAGLRNADLVLVDSPASPPFREHALALALAHARNALLVVDDARIPTVARFCRRLAGRNGAESFETALDHGLFFMGPIAGDRPDDSRSWVETLKAWRRYFYLRGAS